MKEVILMKNDLNVYIVTNALLPPLTCHPIKKSIDTNETDFKCRFCSNCFESIVYYLMVEKD